MKLTLDRSGLRRALREIIVESGYGDVRFRISAPANEAETLILTIEPFQPPSADLITNGVHCVTSAKAVRQNPAAKSSAWMQQREALQADLPAGIYETFLVNDRGQMLEGLSSNFYAITKAGLFTAGEGVLAGISRKIVSEVCAGYNPVTL